MDGGPPRVVHHITYDTLRGDGTRLISLDGVTNYLLDKGYEPHVVIDPFDGRALSLLPANRGGYALRANNRTGDVCYQIEWFFTPGTVYNGKRYDQLYNTPMKGLDRVMGLAASWGIPAVSPLRSGDRNSNTWFNVAGHYGHFNVPSNDHSDPVCSIQSILDCAQAPKPEPKIEPDLEVDMQFIAASPNGKTSYFFDTGTRPWTRKPIPDPGAHADLMHIHKFEPEKGFYGPLRQSLFDMFSDA
ncbi:MAG TPA: hypothetical protein VFQ47_10065 [Nitrososphaera sp.]|nr:hypothetical protein [Nitrososphaera sp.]